jgi:predicted N-acyltransferase
LSTDNTFDFAFIDSIAQIESADWDALITDNSPFLQHAFLMALEQSDCVSRQTGWQPHHCLIYQQQRLVAALPLYIKYHSYGEYIFDFAWAQAYQQQGLHYYPKLLCGIPFTPVTLSKLLGCVPTDMLLPALKQALYQECDRLGLSSIHWLFEDSTFSTRLSQQGLQQRLSVQFHWFNRGYDDFDHFLQSMTARRRKTIRKERQKIQQNDLSVSRLVGQQIQAEDIQLFYACYRETYLKRSGHEGYLSLACFERIWQTMSEYLMLVVAKKQDQPIASALYLFNQHQLCGRYWGALQEEDALHFECCYYQGIEFCIEQQIPLFNPGTQGEHKILRGFNPTWCYSNHYLCDQRFNHAVSQFLAEEAKQLQHYKVDAEAALPFKNGSE